MTHRTELHTQLGVYKTFLYEWGGGRGSAAIGVRGHVQIVGGQKGTLKFELRTFKLWGLMLLV